MVCSAGVPVFGAIPGIALAVVARVGNVVFQGHTLLPAVPDGARPKNGLFVGTTPGNARAERLLTLRSGRHKVIDNDALAKTELYDWMADPGEHTDLAAEDPLRTGGLLQRLLLRSDGDRLAPSNAGGGEAESDL
jgi:hypothetical protein